MQAGAQVETRVNPRHQIGSLCARRPINAPDLALFLPILITFLCELAKLLRFPTRDPSPRRMGTGRNPNDLKS
jgi:hypothetical protein